MGRTTLVICTELENTPGTSVTNAAEILATRLCQEDPTIALEGLIWVEHSPEGMIYHLTRRSQAADRHSLPTVSWPSTSQKPVVPSSLPL